MRSIEDVTKEWHLFIFIIFLIPYVILPRPQISQLHVFPCKRLQEIIRVYRLIFEHISSLFFSTQIIKSALLNTLNSEFAL